MCDPVNKNPTTTKTSGRGMYNNKMAVDREKIGPMMRMTIKTEKEMFSS